MERAPAVAVDLRLRDEILSADTVSGLAGAKCTVWSVVDFGGWAAVAESVIPYCSNRKMGFGERARSLPCAVAGGESG